MADRIDKFFKNKISREEIPFDEELWMQASAELDARKRKRRLIFWILPIGLGLAGILFWNFNNKEIHPRKNAVEANEVAGNLNDSKEIKNPNSEPQIHNQEKSFTQSSSKNTQTNKTNTEKRPSQKPINPNENKAVTIAIDEELPERNVIDKKEFTKFIQTEDPLKIESTINPEETDALELNSAPISFTNLKELPFRVFEINSLILQEEESASEELPIIPLPPFRGLDFSVIVSSVYGFGESANSFYAYQAGFTFEKYLSKKWSLGLGLSYHFRNGNFGQLNQSTQKTYGFGSESNLQRLNLTGIHAVELPIFVSYHWKNNHVNAGFLTRRTLGFSGEKEVQSSSDNLPFTRVAASNGKINDSMLQPGFEYGFSLQYGYQWRQFRFGMLGNSLLNPFSWTDSDGFVRNTAPYSLGVYAQYRLK
jgi:hypothetical protein